jgi:cytochrome d ubiquinol oxidase subunit II
VVGQDDAGRRAAINTIGPLWDGNEVWLILGLKTTDGMRERSWRLARRVAPVTCAAVIGFIIWTHVTAGTTFFLNVIELLAVLAAIATVWLVYERREGFAFAASAVTIAACVVSIFVDLYPNVMVSSTSHAYNLTVHNTASGEYSLKAMTVVVIVFLPLVLAYQAWTYHVFRRRVSVGEFQPAAPEPKPAPEAAATPVRPGN